MSTQKRKFELFARLQSMGFTYDEAAALRRIEMTLQRWAERECGDGSDWAIERAEPQTLALWQSVTYPDGLRVVAIDHSGRYIETVKELPRHLATQNSTSPESYPEEARSILARLQRRENESAGKPFNVYHGEGPRRRYAIADREAGALRRCAAIIAARNARNPTLGVLSFYHQGDPRGCALYILRPGDVPAGEDVGCYYSRGVAVCC